MKPIIKVEDLSKQYRLGTIGTGTLREDVQRWWHKIQGKEDPYLRIGDTNDRSTKGSSEYVWALKDINFEVMPGEVLGIIGKNGAGKSTLLKILSKVTGPTTGRIDYNGRIGSLLEVGTGFHPELTGRENIFLNGAILGMTRREIRSKLDEIIDFSGCERYIDTPVKRYSSGMTVRLGFAVAAHLDPEILVVDEVLAVGDAEFQKKAIGKMQDVSRNEGRTVLFVSHNIIAIKSLCTKSIILANGTIAFDGAVDEGITTYLNDSTNESILQLRNEFGESDSLQVYKIEIRDRDNNPVDNLVIGGDYEFLLYYKNNLLEPLSEGVIASVTVRNEYDMPIFLHHSRLEDVRFKKIGRNGVFKFKLEQLPVLAGEYRLGFSLMNELGSRYFDYLENAVKINILKGKIYGYKEVPPATHGVFTVKGKWEVEVFDN